MIDRDWSLHIRYHIPIENGNYDIIILVAEDEGSDARICDLFIEEVRASSALTSIVR